MTLLFRSFDPIDLSVSLAKTGFVLFLLGSNMSTSVFSNVGCYPGIGQQLLKRYVRRAASSLRQWPCMVLFFFFRKIRMHKMSSNGLAGIGSSAHQLRALAHLSPLTR
ncbi:hypothetical protein VPH35_113442 [Triticum aestivum]